MHIKRRTVDSLRRHFRHDTRAESPRCITGVTHWKRRVRRLRAGDGAARRIAAPRVQWRAPLYAYERSGRGWLLPTDTTSWSRAATTRATFPRLSFARDLRPPCRGWWHRSRRTSRTSRDRVNGERSSSDHLHVRSTIDLRRVVDEGPVCLCACMCIWIKGCGTRRSRSTFCGILALSPWLPPPTPLASATPRGEAARPVRQILPFALHHDSPAPRHVAPASTDRPFRSTISVGSCHHRTGLRTPPDDTAPINRDPVSSPADTFFRLATLVQLLE